MNFGVNMPSNNNIILLDTMVVGGLFAISKINTVAENQNKYSWDNGIRNLLNITGFIESSLIVPTSVCYELMSMNAEWKKYILDNTDKIFSYARYPITNSILQIAAEYSFKSRVVFSDGKTHKIKSFDPITAAYSICFNYPIITENQDDFAESHFQILAIKPIILNGGNGKYRRLLSLLKPKT